MWKQLCTVALLVSSCGMEHQLVVGVSATPPIGDSAWEDRLTQRIPHQADVLFVIDNSPSMHDEQYALAINFPVFLDWFEHSGLDYHIGVVSTDMFDPEHSGKLRSTRSHDRWIDPTTTVPHAAFGQLARVGTGGSLVEAGREAAWTALELLANTENQGFLRDDATLQIVVVSDEDDGSGGDPIDEGEFSTWLLNLKPTHHQVAFHSIVNLNDPHCPPDALGYPAIIGYEYLWITELVGGEIASICIDDWSHLLNVLGEQATGLHRTFYLTQVPLPDTLSVWVEPASSTTPPWTAQMEVDVFFDPVPNSVTFMGRVPEPGAMIHVTYDLADRG